MQRLDSILYTCSDDFRAVMRVNVCILSLKLAFPIVCVEDGESDVTVYCNFFK